mgnify:CR=1 FL=1
MIQLRQYELHNKELNSTLICWLDIKERLKNGARLTLDGVEGVWTVVRTYNIVQTVEEIHASRRWRVGGLL